VWEITRFLSNLTVKDVMVKCKGVISIEPDATLEQAAQITVKNKIGCLPMLEDNFVVGIITDLQADSIPLAERYTAPVVTIGFHAVCEVTEAVSVGLMLDNGGVAWGDCVAVAYSGKTGRAPVFRAEEWANRRAGRRRDPGQDAGSGQCAQLGRSGVGLPRRRGGHVPGRQLC
jgi:hypothetical protein